MQVEGIERKPQYLEVSAATYNELANALRDLGTSGICMRRDDELKPDYGIWSIDLSNNIFGPYYLVTRARNPGGAIDDSAHLARVRVLMRQDKLTAWAAIHRVIAENAVPEHNRYAMLKRLHRKIRRHGTSRGKWYG